MTPIQIKHVTLDLGGGEGEEQCGPVDQDRNSTSLESEALLQVGERHLRYVVSVAHRHRADDGQQVEHDHQRLGQWRVHLHKLQVILVEDVDGEHLPHGQPSKEPVAEGGK